MRRGIRRRIRQSMPMGPASRPPVCRKLICRRLVNKLHSEGTTVKGSNIDSQRILRAPRTSSSVCRCEMPGINDRDRPFSITTSRKIVNYEMESAAIAGLVCPHGTPCGHHLPDHCQPGQQATPLPTINLTWKNLVNYTLDKLTR